MSSFDVSNLFTNVPLDETINICLDSFYTGSNDTIIGLPRNLFKQFLELSVKNSFFLCSIQNCTNNWMVSGWGFPWGPVSLIFLCATMSECGLEIVL